MSQRGAVQERCYVSNPSSYGVFGWWCFSFCPGFSSLSCELSLPVRSHGKAFGWWVYGPRFRKSLQPQPKLLTACTASWHPITTTQHLSWKNCSGFPFQKVLSIKPYVFQCYKWFWSCLPLWTAACLHSVLYTMLFFWHPHAGNPTIQMQESWLSYILLLWTPHLEFTPTRP